MSVLANRMARELRDLEAKPPEGVGCWLRDADGGGGGSGNSTGASLQRLQAQLQGPPGTPYEHGMFRLDVAVPDR
jgi:ubiquitin-protein ligase